VMFYPGSFDGTTLTFASLANAQMSSSEFAGAATSIGNGVGWAVPGNAIGDTSSTSTSVSLDKRDNAKRLALTDFDLNIPADAVIDGLEVSLETAGTYVPAGAALYLTKDGVNVTGSSEDVTSDWGQAFTAGGSGEKWGTTWTAAELNSSNFGLMVLIDGNSWDGQNYSLATAEITVSYKEHIPAPSSLDFVVEVADDTDIEPPETFNVVLSNATTTTTGIASVVGRSASTTIVDNDNLIEFSGTTPDGTVTEDASDGDLNQAVYSIGYSGTLASGEVATVDVTFDPGDTAAADLTGDFATALAAAVGAAQGVSLSGSTLTFSGDAGSVTSIDVTLTVVDDGDIEPPEDFTVTLSDQTTDTTGTATIVVD